MHKETARKTLRDRSVRVVVAWSTHALRSLRKGGAHDGSSKEGRRDVYGGGTARGTTGVAALVCGERSKGRRQSAGRVTSTRRASAHGDADQARHRPDWRESHVRQRL